MRYHQPSLFARGSPAKTSPAPGEEPVSRERKAPSGSKSCELCDSPDPVGRLLRTVLLSELGAWTRSMQVWKRQVTPAGRSWWVLKTLGLRTGASGPGLLPTLRANKRGLPDSHGNTEAWGRLLPTLCSSNSGTNKGGGGSRVGPERPSLTTLSRRGLLPTLQAHDANPGNAKRIGRYGTKHGGKNLNDEILLYPTLMAPDADHSGPNQRDSKGRPGLLPTLLSRDARTLAGNANPPHHQGGESLTQKLKGSLNADWCEWFQGYPLGWTEIEDPGPSGPTVPRRSKNKGTVGRGSAD